MSADVAGSGRLLAVESLVFGRTAMGERYDSGTLHDAWRIRCDERLMWADTLRLGRFTILGHSFGGRVALATAGWHADRAAAVVLVAATVGSVVGAVGSQEKLGRVRVWV